MKYNRVIWDFNGTILDDVQLDIDSGNELLIRYGLPLIRDVEHYHELFGFPIKDYYVRLGFDFDKLDYSVVAHEWVDIYLRRINEAHLREGIFDVISELRQMQIPQTVLSMTEENMLRHQIDILGITEFFDEIKGLNNVYATSKIQLAKAWREEHPNENVLYIGDTTHDSESAEMIGCDCYLITGGHQSTKSLLQSGAKVIYDINSVIDILKNR